MKIIQGHFFLPYLAVSGTYFDIGYQIGTRFRKQIQNIVNRKNAYFNLIYQKDQQNHSYFVKVFNLTEQHFPHYIDELKGYSEGSDVDFWNLFLLNCLDNVNLTEKCSDICYKLSDRLILGHNEDFDNEISENSYFLHMTIDNNLEIFTHAYPGLLPGFSFATTSHGITISCNSTPLLKQVVGVPRPFIDRSLLEAQSLEELIARCNFHPRAGGFSYNIISSKDHSALNIETTYKDFIITQIDDRFYHTNHYLNPELKDIPVDPLSTTFKRYSGLEQYVPESSPSLKSVFNILSSNEVFTSQREMLPGLYGKTFALTIFKVTKTETEIHIWPHSLNEANKIELLMAHH